jgi:RNA polymerase sigma-70 factor (ECF subfamily)
MSTNPSHNPHGEGYPSQSGEAERQIPATDLDLWQRTKLGDEQAIADLYDRYSPLIYRVACHVLHDSGISEDVVQEVLLQLWRVPDAFDPAKGSLVTWLTLVSRRRAIDRLRQRKAEVDVAELIVPIHATQLADATLNQMTDKVNALLNDMPEKLRVTFEMAYFQGMTHTEISERLGDPLGTTKSRIRLALNFIRTRLDGNRTNTKE